MLNGSPKVASRGITFCVPNKPIVKYPRNNNTVREITFMIAALSS